MNEGQFPNHVTHTAKEFIERLKAGQEDAGIAALHEQIDSFSPEARTYLQFLTLTFLEQDVMEKTLKNPDAIEEIKRKFALYGADQQTTDKVIEYFTGKLPQDPNRQ